MQAKLIIHSNENYSVVSGNITATQKGSDIVNTFDLDIPEDYFNNPGNYNVDIREGTISKV